MPKQPQAKSTHLQELEAVFDRRTRRFSPFAVLGLNRSEQEDMEAQTERAVPESGEPPPPPHKPPPPPPIGDPPPPPPEKEGRGKSSRTASSYSKKTPTNNKREWDG